jgi:hypothetical protein
MVWHMAKALTPKLKEESVLRNTEGTRLAALPYNVGRDETLLTARLEIGHVHGT